jgi:hypothetical protein
MGFRWGGLLGPSLPFDTDKYFVICANVLGSCYGTTGPTSTDPTTKLPYGGAFDTIQGTFDTIQGTFDANEGIFDIIQGTFGCSMYVRGSSIHFSIRNMDRILTLYCLMKNPFDFN